jgi:uncharacterized membrane protein YbaN (DUF454 family)
MIRKSLFIVVGWCCVLLGIIGVFLPLLPTTPFMILALLLFARSSPRLHRMLLDNRWFGPGLQQWEKDRSISRSAKLRAMLLVVLTFAISITILSARPWLQLMLLGLMSGLLLLLWRLRETPLAVSDQAIRK